MISTMTPTPVAACPVATAAPRAAVVAVARLRARETSALRPVLGGGTGDLATGLTVGGAGSNARGAVSAFNAPVQGPPSRGTPV